MATRRQYLRWAGVGFAGALAGCEGSRTTTMKTTELPFSSDAFANGDPIPETYTDDGADRSPPLSIEAVPDGTETLALVLDDPDAGGFVHWLLWNLPAGEREIPEGLPGDETLSQLGGARQGTNGFGTIGYRGPAPPAENPPHTYRCTLSALDTELAVPAGAERSELESALEGHVLTQSRITGTYDR